MPHYGEIKDDLINLDNEAEYPIKTMLENDGEFRLLLLRVLHSIAYDLNSIAYTFRKPRPDENARRIEDDDDINKMHTGGGE